MSGILGRSALVATMNTSVYIVPTGKLATVNISVCNRGNSPTKVRLALCDSDTPSDADYIEYDITILANGVLERSGVVLQAEKQIIAYAETSNTSIVVFGFEE